MADNIRDWLTTLELEHWGDVFEANHVALRDVALLTDDDLQDLGLPLGPRRRIVNAAAMLAGNLGVEPRATNRFNRTFPSRTTLSRTSYYQS